MFSYFLTYLLMAKPKKHIVLLFGGKSGEHEVSLQSARSVYQALDQEKYNITLIGIDKQGIWHSGSMTELIQNGTNPKLIKLNNSTPEVQVVNGAKGTAIVETNNSGESGQIDVVFPIMHGTYGEDGCIQGLLELLDVAYVGPDVLGSAVGMDKDIMKRLLKEAGLPIARFHTLRKNQSWEKQLPSMIDDLKLPIFIKPANLGSSVGISKAHDETELRNGIEKAFAYDTKILLEETIHGREIECAVLGNDTPAASLPGEVIPTHEFYSYEAKYIDENGAHFAIPAKLDEETVKKIQTAAIKTFTTLECSGMSRVDFFLLDNGNLYINEINTIPGFTSISMYPKLWEVSGISYEKLLDRLIELALEKKEERTKLKRDFHS